MTGDESSGRDEVLDALDDIRNLVDDDRELESTEPGEAFDLWLEQQYGEKTASTIGSYERRVKPFLRYLDTQGIEDLNEVTTRHVKAFEAQRKSKDVQKNTLNNQFGTIRLFLQYCEQLNAVSVDVVAALDIPGLSKDERVNTEKLPPQRAREILDNLERYRFASREHVVFLLLWHTTARMGTIRALDVDDVYFDHDDLERIRVELEAEGYHPDVIEDVISKAVPPFLYPRHRPEEETPLKNAKGGERTINISASVAAVLRNYLDVNRADVEDEYGREPLISSQKGSGRLSGSAIRNWCYILTQPCEFGGECPYGEDPETCVAREHGQGSKCPGSKSPHKIRTGAVTHHVDREWPPEVLSKRANTSKELIEGVYDQPEELTRGRKRRRFLENLEDGNGADSS